MPVLVRKSWPQSASVLSILMSGGLIRKSEGLWNQSEHGFHGFGPKELFDDRDDHPYNDEETPGLKPHHTPFGYETDPETGEKVLRYHDDGTPFGFHPIDALRHDMAKHFREAGYDRDPKVFIQHAINAFNEHHMIENERGEMVPGPHAIPGFDSVKWRRNFAGPYQGGRNKRAHSREMQTHGLHPTHPDGTRMAGAHAPMQTLNLNSGNVNRRGAARGPFVDSGFIPFYRELKQIMQAVNQGLIEKGQTPIETKYMEYLERPAIYPRKMSHGEVAHLRNAPYTAETGLLQGQTKTDSPHANVNAHSVLGAYLDGNLPQAFISVPRETREDIDRRFKARRGAKGAYDEELDEPTGGVHGKAVKMFRDAGLQLTEEEMERFVHMPLAQVMFGQPNDRGIPRAILHALAAEHGTEIGSDEHVRHRGMLASTSRMDKERELGIDSKGRHEYARNLAGLGRLVMSQGGDFGDSDYLHPGYTSEIEDHELADKILSAMVEYHGIDPHDYTAELQPSEGHGMAGQDHAHPEHYKEHMVLTSKDMAPNENQKRPSFTEEELAGREPQAQPLQMRPAPMAEPPRYATAAEEGRRRAIHQTATEGGFEGLRRPVPQYAIPDESGSVARQGTLITPEIQSRMQAATAPGQTFFTPQGQLLLRGRDDVLGAMDSVLKAMENLQLEAAMEDATVMKHVPTRLDTGSTTEVGMFAKSLGLTGHDVRAIHSAQGDWSKVAKQWSVNEKTVRVIKAAMRGSLS